MAKPSAIEKAKALLSKYSVTITRTADGSQEYMQIISADQFSTNIVLIGEFLVRDARKEGGE